MVFPDSEPDAGAHRIMGRVIGRCRDGIWICFNRNRQSDTQAHFAGEP